MDILDKIVAYTKALVEERRAELPLGELKAKSAAKAPRKTISLAAKLTQARPHIIAEFKRKSPSRPNISLNADPVEIARLYQNGGASAMSVLTEPGFFAGTPADLRAIRPEVGLPLLRKDFIISPYQIYEAREMGADLILLIARIIEKEQLNQWCGLAHELGMEVLCEIHHPEELAKIGDTPIDFLGVNCRDLTRFQTNIDHLIDLAAVLPAHIPWVAESGIHGRDALQRLYAVGYRLFLIGEYLMKEGHTVERLQELARP